MHSLHKIYIKSNDLIRQKCQFFSIWYGLLKGNEEKINRSIKSTSVYREERQLQKYKTATSTGPKFYEVNLLLQLQIHDSTY